MVLWKSILLFVMFFCLSFIISFGVCLYLKLPYRFGPGMCLDFKETEALSNQVHLLASFDSYEVNFEGYIKEYEFSSPFYHVYPHDKPFAQDYYNIFGADSCGSSFYACDSDKLYEMDWSGAVKRSINISEFRLMPEDDYVFGSYLTVAEDSIWVPVYSQNGLPKLVMEWNLYESPENRMIHEFKWAEESPNMFGEVGLEFTNEYGEWIEVGLYHLDAKEIVNTSWAEYYDRDFKSESLVASHDGCSDRDSFIYQISPDQSKKKITWGSMALWGSDGYLYFTRGSSQLWRWNSNDGKIEKVFSASKQTVPCEICRHCRLLSDKSRRYFVFLYW